MRLTQYLLKRRMPVLLSARGAGCLFMLLAWASGILFALSYHPAYAEVVLSSFTASVMGDSILLEWTTVSEINNVGFFIQRAQQANGPYVRISPYFPTLSENGEGDEYFWFDDVVEADQVYYYRLEAIDTAGVSQFFGPIPGSLNTALLTGTPLASPTPGRTASPATASATPTTTRQPTAAGQRTATIGSSGALSVSPTASLPAPEGTQMIELTQTETPAQSSTPTLTRTLEPLPTIELIFPPTSTPPPAEVASAEHPTPSGETLENDARAIRWAPSPQRWIVLMALVGALWLCLGGLLVFLARRLGD